MRLPARIGRSCGLLALVLACILGTCTLPAGGATLGKARVHNFPTRAYLGTNSAPLTLEWSADVAAAAVSFHITLEPAGAGYASTSEIVYSGALYSQSFFIHAPTEAPAGGLRVLFSVSGADAALFESGVEVAVATTSSPAWSVPGNSFALTLAPTSVLTISGVPLSLYTNELASSPLAVQLGEALTGGSGGAVLNAAAFVASTPYPQSISPLALTEGSGLSFTLALTAPPQSGTLVLSFSLSGGDASHYVLSPGPLYQVTILEPARFAFPGGSLPAQGLTMAQGWGFFVSLGGAVPAGSVVTITPAAFYADTASAASANAALMQQALAPSSSTAEAAVAVAVAVSASSYTVPGGTFSPASLQFSSGNSGPGTTGQLLTFTPALLPTSEPYLNCSVAWSVSVSNNGGAAVTSPPGFAVPAARVLRVSNPAYVLPASSSSSSSSSSSTGVEASSSSTAGSTGMSWSSSSTGANDTAAMGTGSSSSSTGGGNGTTVVPPSGSSSSSSSSDQLIIILVCVGLGVVCLALCAAVYFLRASAAREAAATAAKMAEQKSTLEMARLDGQRQPLPSELRDRELQALAAGSGKGAAPRSYGAAAVAHTLAAEAAAAAAKDGDEREVSTVASPSTGGGGEDRPDPALPPDQESSTVRDADADDELADLQPGTTGTAAGSGSGSGSASDLSSIKVHLPPSASASPQPSPQQAQAQAGRFGSPGPLGPRPAPGGRAQPVQLRSPAPQPWASQQQQGSGQLIGAARPAPHSPFQPRTPVRPSPLPHMTPLSGPAVASDGGSGSTSPPPTRPSAMGGQSMGGPGSPPGSFGQRAGMAGSRPPFQPRGPPLQQQQQGGATMAPPQRQALRSPPAQF